MHPFCSQGLFDLCYSHSNLSWPITFERGSFLLTHVDRIRTRVPRPSNRESFVRQIIVVVLAISAPCELPAIAHGQYLLGYRAGLTIANGSFVTFQCDPEFIKTTSVSIECVLGRLVPKVPSCKRGEPTTVVVFREPRGNTDLMRARSRWRPVHYGRGHFEKERAGHHRPVVRAPRIVRTAGIGARINGVPERGAVERRGEEVKNRRVWSPTRGALRAAVEKGEGPAFVRA